MTILKRKRKLSRKQSLNLERQLCLYIAVFSSLPTLYIDFFFFNQKNHWSLFVRYNLLGQDFHTKNQSLDSNRINSPTKFFVKNLLYLSFKEMQNKKGEGKESPLQQRKTFHNRQQCTFLPTVARKDLFTYIFKQIVEKLDKEMSSKPQVVNVHKDQNVPTVLEQQREGRKSP